MEKLFAALGIPFENAERVSTNAILQILAATLEPQESMVIVRHCGVGCPGTSKRTLVVQLNLNEYKMRQVFSRALGKLQHPSRRDQLVALAKKAD